MLMFKYGYAAIALAVTVAIAASGIKGYSLGAASVKAELLAAQEVARDKEQLAQTVVNAVSATLITEIGKIRVVNKTINKEIEREIRTEHVFSNPVCALPDAAFGLLNDKAESFNTRVSGGKQSAVRPDPVTD